MRPLLLCAMLTLAACARVSAADAEPLLRALALQALAAQTVIDTAAAIDDGDLLPDDGARLLMPAIDRLNEARTLLAREYPRPLSEYVEIGQAQDATLRASLSRWVDGKIDAGEVAATLAGIAPDQTVTDVMAALGTLGVPDEDIAAMLAEVAAEVMR